MSAGLAVLLRSGTAYGAAQASTSAFVVNRLPLWFLVFALFLPRIALVVAWLQGVLVPFHLHGIIPPLFWLLLPRILVLYLIYVDQGLTLWFPGPSGGGAAGLGRRRTSDRRRRRRDDY